MTMRARKLGTITIGQAPRPDITPILDAAIGADIPRLHAGLLDGLTRQEVAARFAPAAGRAELITRLLDGTVVTIDRQAAQQAAQVRLAELEAAGCTTILLLCTGQFAHLACRTAWLVEPDRIVPPAVAALAGERQVGIMVPLASQVASEAGKWAGLARPPICAVASPYAGDDAAVAAAGRELAGRGAELLVMDCMGFVEHHRRAAIEGSDRPVILSNALIAKLTAEVL
jgi:protein AroM